MPPSATTGRQHQVLLHRQAGEDAALLGDEADAGVGGAVEGEAHQVQAVEARCVPVRLRTMPMMARERRRLADAVAAEERDGLARGRR